MKDFRYYQLKEIRKACLKSNDALLVEDFLKTSKHCSKDTIYELMYNGFIQEVLTGKGVHIKLDIKGEDYLTQRYDARTVKRQAITAIIISATALLVSIGSFVMQYLI